MGRGPKPTKGKPKPAVSRQSPKSDDARIRDLEKRLAEAHEQLRTRDRALTEALDQQTATSEILSVIATSPIHLKRVLDTLAESAARFCTAYDADIWRLDGDVLRVVGHHGPIPTPLGHITPVIRGTVVGRSALDRQTVQVTDLQAEVDEFPEGSASARQFGHRSIVSVPLLREGVPIGAITLRRTEVHPFTGKQLDLLKTFADQAVIAIENVRLFKEMREALDRQTATAEILRVISSSPTDVQPVFETIADSAMRLFGAWSAAVWRYDGEYLIVVAARGGRPGSSEAMLKRSQPRRPADAPFAGRTVSTRRVQQIVDVETDPTLEPVIRESARERGWRTTVQAPMLRGNDVLGVIGVTRSQSGEFSPAEVALLQTFADQAVIAIENVRLFTELQEKNRALTEALEQQTATGEILRVISSSPTDVQPVFDSIVRNAVRLCGAIYGTAYRIDGDVIDLVAQVDLSGAGWERFRTTFPRPLHDGGVLRDVVESRRLLYLPNVDAYPFSEAARAMLAANNARSLLTVPMIRQDRVVGAFSIFNQDENGFSKARIALVQTFADQAVIAIENVRLFTQVQEKNQALTEAHAQVIESLDQQTATAEILRVISQSPTDVQPVFEVVLASGVRLCGASFGGVFRFDGELIHLVTSHEWPAEQLKVVYRRFPMPPGDGSLAARAIRDGAVVQTPDYVADSRAGILPEWAPQGEQRPRSTIAIPMLREGTPLGAIVLARSEPGLFSDKHVALLQTFADQAVIAIENVRLFTELQARNRELTTALDTQTATSDILRVISRSQRDVQPVFDAIVASAVRLLRGYFAALTRLVGDQIELAAATSSAGAEHPAVRTAFPQSVHNSESVHAQAIRQRGPVNVADAQTDPAIPEALRAVARARGFRSLVAVPLLRQREALGTIAVARREPGGFTDDEIALLQTFADQAVIAIENARLLSELQERTQELTRSVDQLTALGEVGRAVSSTLDLETVLTTIVTRAVQLSGVDGGVVFEYDDATEEFIHRAATEQGSALAVTRRATRVRKGEGVLGRTAVTLEPDQVEDISVAGAYESRLRDDLIESGIRALLAVPMVREGHLIGGLVVSRNAAGGFPSETIDLLRTFATQSALAIQNARLFREIEEKSRQLEDASQHKSEFLASMSHELRTPLNAIIGFSEVLSERMFGDLNEKQDEYLKDIHASGQHLLSLINDILDLSKIEAGRMELEVTDFNLPMTIDNAMTLIRERAARRGIALHSSVDERLGQIQADERKIRQVLLNLLSNAIKFTPEGGRIAVGAKPVNGSIEVSVTDTGVGIAPEDQEAVFEEFRQVGTSDKKVEGTGLGLTLCRKFVELHGGRIWVKSRVNEGSTFTFTIPVRSSE